jgi:hypothetical protein
MRPHFFLLDRNHRILDPGDGLVLADLTCAGRRLGSVFGERARAPLRDSRPEPWKLARDGAMRQFSGRTRMECLVVMPRPPAHGICQCRMHFLVLTTSFRDG